MVFGFSLVGGFGRAEGGVCFRVFFGGGFRFCLGLLVWVLLGFFVCLFVCFK